METQQAYYISKIKEHLSYKQRQNPHYSLRAYARDIGVRPATLSQIMKGNRPLPIKDSSLVVNKLNLGPKERTLFMESLLNSKTQLDNLKIDEVDTRFLLDESYYKVISEWEHYAVLELFDLKDFVCSTSSVMKVLDLTETRTEVVISNLLVCGLLLKEEDGKFIKTHSDVKTTEDITSQALRESHIEAMKMGIDKIEKIAVDLRDFSSATLALDINKLPEAKRIIREFRKKMAVLVAEGDKTDVFQLAIQFYPLTNPVCKKS